MFLGPTIKDLLSFWTGMEILPGRQKFLSLKVDAERSPELLAESKTCFRELILPVHNSFTAFKEMMTKTLTYGSKGFSMV